MNERANYYINKIYFEGDWDLFVKKTKSDSLYLDSLIEVLETHATEVEVYNEKTIPAIEIWISFEKYECNEFCVEYKTLLQISKVADLFTFQHIFYVENKDPNRMTPILDGFGGEAYILLQNKVENEAKKILKEHGLQCINLNEMDEVIYNMDMPEKSLFGNQMTLENALFRDIYGICER